MSRDDILDAAAQIFRQKGFHATSMQDIADAVSLQKASLYHHVASKQEILAAILDQALDMLIARMEAVVAQDLTPADKVCAALGAYLEALSEFPDLAAVLLLEHRSLEKEYKRNHIPRRDRFEGLWRQLINEGIQAGDFDCADPDLGAKTLLGVANWTITWYRPGGRLTAAEIADFSAGLLLQGLQVRRGANGRG